MPVRLYIVGLAVVFCLLFAASANALDKDITAFPKWTRVMERTPHHTLSPAVRLAVLKAVHAAYKDYTYKSDYALYGTKDYWATPAEFEAHQAGDCEDFAIAKYYDLMALGFDEWDMRIVIVFKPDGVLHALLVVRIDKKILVLDNEYPDKLLRESHLQRFGKAYTINRLGWER